ncbi:T6SS protein Cts2N [Citrobacter amalonaticus]|uniref:T6SS protein Cts2N n=1 Tax=Citrobacter amalonaticus TaxID=35703 RepID=A0A2S4RXJ1_CITAM|nr:T6SS protein Cts2N [Citrobacter amalonaticus]POT56140.1 T6SS protein Cts2N [Citrobacter amalonaticus]POT74449.1 T6SS protein Cts2N [Citrobacter amalonaticus]POU65248.1 T6SS protein Cts2N [Citrobacter amalonaticus]POV04083.1 T6SS protein Cts2N [Citrobacter amalonaticus]
MTTGICHSARIILFSFLILLNSGCSFWQNRVELKAVVIETVPDANDNAPVAVDIVAVGNSVLIPTIQALSAAQWFNAKSQLLRDAPDGLRVWSLELVPGSRFVAKEPPLQGVPAEAILLFARYRSEGEHRLRLDKTDSLHLLLMTDEVVLAP